MKNQRLTAKVKIIIIVAYTVVVFGAILLLLGNPKDKRFDNYGNKAYDENIAINLRETENRSSKYKTGTSEKKGEHAKSSFDFRITLIKLKSNTKIENIRLYLAAKTANGSYRYDEYSSSTKSMSSGVYTSITTLSSFATKSFEKIAEDGESIDYLFNETPEELFVKITYSLSGEKEVRTLAYRTTVLYKNPEEDFEKAELRNVLEANDVSNPKYIDVKDDPVRVRLTKTKAEEVTKLGNVEEDQIRVQVETSSINLNKLKNSDDYLKENLLTAIELPKLPTDKDAWDVAPEISDIKLEIWVKINSDDDSFSDYVKIYSIYGFVSKYRSLTVTTCKIDESLDLSEIYIAFECDIYNGTKSFCEGLYKVGYNSLPDIE